MLLRENGEGSSGRQTETGICPRGLIIRTFLIATKQKSSLFFNFLRFLQNREKFKKLGSKAKGKDSELWEFKSFQHRFLGDYRPHSRFIIAHALQKKIDNLPTSDIARAIRILQENDQREEGMP